MPILSFQTVEASLRLILTCGPYLALSHHIAAITHLYGWPHAPPNNHAIFSSASLKDRALKNFLIDILASMDKNGHFMTKIVLLSIAQTIIFHHIFTIWFDSVYFFIHISYKIQV